MGLDLGLGLDLDVYRLALDVARFIATSRFAPGIADLRDQAVRASRSVVLNIGEAQQVALRRVGAMLARTACGCSRPCSTYDALRTFPATKGRNRRKRSWILDPSCLPLPGRGGVSQSVIAKPKKECPTMHVAAFLSDLARLPSAEPLLRHLEANAGRLRGPLTKGQFWGYALADGIRAALLDARPLLRLLHWLRRPDPPTRQLALFEARA